MHKANDVVTGSMEIAYSEAIKRHNTEVSAAHLLLGLLLNPATRTAKILTHEKSNIIGTIEKLARSTTPITMNDLRPSADFSKWTTLASSHAVQQGREIQEKDLVRHIHDVFPELIFDQENFIAEDETLEAPEFLINLGELANLGKLDPVIGRTKEIRSVMEILGRRAKNNPVLVGPAGVGKTAIVEGLALAIHKNQVPDVLKGRVVYSLELGSLMAGTKFRGEFEERIQKLLAFIKEKSGEAILFIDEIHQLVGAGRTDGAMDAANLLKPALARGDLHCIGATTADEYQKYILGDSALDRRFRSVMVDEPSKEDAVEIVMGLKEKLEIHHGIKIADEAIISSVFLSDQYITDKNLPDKAIDLIDESASALKLSAESMPAHLMELAGEIRSQKINAQVKGNTKDSKREIRIFEEKFNREKKLWEEKVFAIKQVSELKNKLDHLKFDLEQAELQGAYEKAGKIKYAQIPEIENQLSSCDHDWILGSREVAMVIERQTGIPVDKILKSKQDHILEIEHHLNQNVYGQKQAIHEIAETLITSHAGLADESRPLGSFLLLGPSGVGKTETAKTIAKFLFNSDKSLIRLDLSEYSEKHSVAKLIGAPAGYVGYEEGGVLTEAVRRKPYSVILFDEIEKAHPDFGNIALQILDDGRLTDNKGRLIDFKNTILIFTSNSSDIEKDFRPELLGRIDGILHYKNLDKGVMTNIIDKQLALLNEKLTQQKLAITLHKDIYHTLAEKGYSETYGARPLHSVFNNLIMRPLSRQLLSGVLPEGNVVCELLNGDIHFRGIEPS